MSVKALMVDVDGVIIVHPHGRRWDWNIEADLLLIDDLVLNVEAARACGWGAVAWDGTQRLALVTLACALICRRRLRHASPRKWGCAR